MPARQAQGVDRHSVVGLPLKEENHATISVCWLRDAGLCHGRPFHRRLGARRKGKELPHGAAVPLAEFQENLRLGESLPLAAVAAVKKLTESVIT
jgi:hypothetical protein